MNKTKCQNVNDLGRVFIEISINLESYYHYRIIMNLWKASEPAPTPRRRPTPPPIRTKSANKKSQFRPKRKPKRKPRPTAPAPTDFVGEKPTWEEYKQKGNVCQPTTTAAVPCKQPLKRKQALILHPVWQGRSKRSVKVIIQNVPNWYLVIKIFPAGKKCDEKISWSDYGYVRSEVTCKKVKGGVLRRELRQECTEKAGSFQCWKHWSQTGCTTEYCADPWIISTTQINWSFLAIDPYCQMNEHDPYDPCNYNNHISYKEFRIANHTCLLIKHGPSKSSHPTFWLVQIMKWIKLKSNNFSRFS